MTFIDKYDKKITLHESYIEISKPETKYGHSFNRKIPYSAIKNMSSQTPTFFHYGYLSLHTLTSGISFTKKMNPGQYSVAVDDETTFMFDKNEIPVLQQLISKIKEYRSNPITISNSLTEFWGITYASTKHKTATLLPEGICYKCGGQPYILPYSEILKFEYISDEYHSDIVILRKGLDEKYRLQQYKKSNTINNDDEKYCIEIFDIYQDWAKNFFKALSIIIDNKHLIAIDNNNEISEEKTLLLLDGYEFEKYCAELLKNNGFTNIDITPKSGDQGVDILATKDSIKYAFQCKRYTSSVGNSSVQEVFAGKNFYNCHVGVVMTDSEFTPSAIALANTTGILLWDKKKLESMK